MSVLTSLMVLLMHTEIWESLVLLTRETSWLHMPITGNQVYPRWSGLQALKPEELKGSFHRKTAGLATKVIVLNSFETTGRKLLLALAELWIR